MASEKQLKENATYFKRTNFVAGTLVLFGMILCHLGTYNPSVVPCCSLGPLKKPYRYMAIHKPWIMSWTYHTALLVHLFEGLLTIPLTKSKGITNCSTRCKWFFQTVLFGIFSLKDLLSYKPKIEKEE